MSEFGDTAIKLFGRTITPLFGANHESLTSTSVSACAGASGHGKETSFSSSSSSSCSSLLGPDRVKSATDCNIKEDKLNYSSKDPQISSDINKDPKTSTETSSPKSQKNNVDQQSEITTTTTTMNSKSQEKTTLKKPNKILPCPRCNSTDTKFCYYNNYNVNQPRHFCRNCQRYWTAGGSMRNVPVGAGRRKNKNSVSSKHCLQINPLNSNSSATILSFGPSNSLVSEVVHDKFRVSLQEKLETFNDNPGEMNKTVGSGSTEIKNSRAFLPSQGTFPVPPPPWPYQWNPAIPNANFYPLQLYWGCTVPFMSPPKASPSPSPGKRLRDENFINSGKEGKEAGRNEFLPESLRIDEQSEAAKSSVRSVLATKPEKTDKFSLFSGFETKSNNWNFMTETSLALQANPAAVARSLNFYENM